MMNARKLALARFDFNQIGPRLPAPAAAFSRIRQAAAPQFSPAFRMLKLPCFLAFRRQATDRQTLPRNVSRSAQSIPFKKLKNLQGVLRASQ